MALHKNTKNVTFKLSTRLLASTTNVNKWQAGTAKAHKDRNTKSDVAPESGLQVRKQINVIQLAADLYLIK